MTLDILKERGVPLDRQRFALREMRSDGVGRAAGARSVSRTGVSVRHADGFTTDAVARMLYAEIASIEEEHVTQYDSLALLAKFEVADVHEGGPTRAELERIRDDERRHFVLLRDAMIRTRVEAAVLGQSGVSRTPSREQNSVQR